jgi:hypothetical protein
VAKRLSISATAIFVDIEWGEISKANVLCAWTVWTEIYVLIIIPAGRRATGKWSIVKGTHSTRYLDLAGISLERGLLWRMDQPCLRLLIS